MFESMSTMLLHMRNLLNYIAISISLLQGALCLWWNAVWSHQHAHSRVERRTAQKNKTSAQTVGSILVLYS